MQYRARLQHLGMSEKAIQEGILKGAHLTEEVDDIKQMGDPLDLP